MIEIDTDKRWYFILNQSAQEKMFVAWLAILNWMLNITKIQQRMPELTLIKLRLGKNALTSIHLCE